MINKKVLLLGGALAIGYFALANRGQEEETIGGGASRGGGAFDFPTTLEDVSNIPAQVINIPSNLFGEEIQPPQDFFNQPKQPKPQVFPSFASTSPSPTSKKTVFSPDVTGANLAPQTLGFSSDIPKELRGKPALVTPSGTPLASPYIPKKIVSSPTKSKKPSVSLPPLSSPLLYSPIKTPTKKETQFFTPAPSTPSQPDKSFFGRVGDIFRGLF
tara:strand:- start:900 stop:1544 length:645 start_codon:yes stop_codon:yes gene_type:complete